MIRIRGYAAALASLLLASACVRSAVIQYSSTVKSAREGTLDFAVAYRTRIEGVESLVPPGVRVGYLSDQSDMGEYFLTQYFLTPRVVVQGDQADFVIIDNHPAGVFGKAPLGSPLVSKQEGGRTEYDFGNGIKLIDQRPSR